jgi:hypothetical protein
MAKKRRTSTAEPTLEEIWFVLTAAPLAEVRGDEPEGGVVWQASVRELFSDEMPKSLSFHGRPSGWGARTTKPLSPGSQRSASVNPKSQGAGRRQGSRIHSGPLLRTSRRSAKRTRSSRCSHDSAPARGAGEEARDDRGAYQPIQAIERTLLNGPYPERATSRSQGAVPAGAL